MNIKKFNLVAIRRTFVSTVLPFQRSSFQPAASRVLILGSGGLSIGQAGEFDYSGSQALKALKQENVKTILINSNIATVQTGSMADSVYFLPITPTYVEKVIEKERPDGILLTFGGQTALNCGIELHKAGVFEKYGTKILGTPVETLIATEDRAVFADKLKEINIPIAKSTAVESVDDALAAAESIGYPVIVRSAFALGGLGSGFANDSIELSKLATASLALSPQILVEKSMKGWKEIEYEVVRDKDDNCITVCNMENFDPLGIHTGDSIVVAPSQTLTDPEYQMLRTAAIKIVRHMGVVGECNVQYALNPDSSEFAVIEMNARLSRSSALASKATGYPLAFVAAKIALGATLPQIKNGVTMSTSAFFEPSLDYVVTKIPRWDLAKFNHVSRGIGSSMKSVGESMAIGRTFEESLQKAIRQVGPKFLGFDYMKEYDCDSSEIESVLQKATDSRLFYIATAMFEHHYSVDRIHELTKIDKWFLYKLEKIKNTKLKLQQDDNLTIENLIMSKKLGFSDKQIANNLKISETDVRNRRKEFGVLPYVKQIDTLAGEVPAVTNYLYTTYNACEDDITFDEKGIMILGSGVYRIGSSVEFDWCGVGTTRSIRESGGKTVLVNYNPETVSTDYDEVDRLYFEELSYERVMDIYEKENPSGIIVSVGGQLPQNIALRLKKEGNAKILGTDPEMIDKAENRFEFSKKLDSLNIDQPRWKELVSTQEALSFAEEVGYPCLVRPSYVLSGAAMNVAYNKAELEKFLNFAADISPDHPVVVTKFLKNAKEIDVDGVAHKGKLLVHAISEHVEEGGVHSGDASLILPPNLAEDSLKEIKDIASKIANAFMITGPFNMQILKCPDNSYKVIECNIRASRSFPFVSKVLDLDFIDVSVKALLELNVPQPIDLMDRIATFDYKAVKVAQFSWTRLPGADPFLGVEMASTGEVACFGKDEYEAYNTAIQAVNGFRLPSKKSNILVSVDSETNENDFKDTINCLSDLGFSFTSSDSFSDECFKRINVKFEPLSKDATSDRRAFWNELNRNKISLVISLGKTKCMDRNDHHYLIRRMAVDLGIPLINNEKCALLFAECLKRVENEGIERQIYSWKEFLAGQHVGNVGFKAVLINN